MEARATRPRRRFSVEDYHRMAEAGILGEDDRVELLDGELVEMTPIGSPHAGVVNHLNRTLVRAVGDRAVVAVQNPIALDPSSEPQPDLALLRSRSDFYRSAHAEPPDVLLLVEVADTSVAFERRVKVPLYARAGVAECWIVDLPGEVVETHRDPAGGRYRVVERLGPGARVAPASLPDVGIDVGDLLAPRR